MTKARNGNTPRQHLLSALRIAWAIHSGDMDAFRRAVKLSHTMWGGRYNPIVFADRFDDARELVDLFRADVVWPVGESPEVAGLPARFPYLINPIRSERLFWKGDQHSLPHAYVLDVRNMLVHWRDRPEWQALRDRRFRHYLWEAGDPLADVFLVQLGAYPDTAETGIDYLAAFLSGTGATETRLPETGRPPEDLLGHPGIAQLSRHALDRHYGVRAGWDQPGFFLGDASSLDDLACWWNLRAADIGVMFVDERHADRLADVMGGYDRMLRESRAHLMEFERDPAIWSRGEAVRDLPRFFAGKRFTRCGVRPGTWNGFNVRAPMMKLGEASVLGVVEGRDARQKVSFALAEKPLSSDLWFSDQHLVASVSMIGGWRDEQLTFGPPYVPELNEFYARTMRFDYSGLRIEPGRIGIVIDAFEHDAFLNAIPVPALAEKLFGLAGFEAKPSGGGLITRQVIARLGGVDGARVFKIPGVRRLLKTYGPTAAFTRHCALQLIGGKDPENPEGRFADHKGLYIEPREESQLTSEMVFAFLVEKGLFRIGAVLTCQTCRLTSWIALDALRQRNVCELCGTEYDATRQLVNGVFHYRRTGVLGLEKNTQGAIPVALTLQQLWVNLHFIGGGMYVASYELARKDAPACEIDFVMICPRVYPDRCEVLIGECKDRGGAIDANDIENLRQVADAFPKDRFQVYIVLSKLSPFTDAEIDLAKSLNTRFQRRVIMLTPRELEPYFMYERVKKEFGIAETGGAPEALAGVTAKVYFGEAKTAGT